MKKLKTLISVVLSAMLVLSLVVPSMADETAYTITINNADNNETYSAYKVFDYVASAPTSTTGVYVASAALKEALEEEGITGVTFNGSDGKGGFYVQVTDGAVKDLVDFLKENKGLLTLVEADKAPTAGVVTFNVTQKGAGYYFVDTTAGSLCILNTTTPTISVNDKNTDVTVDKVLKDAEGDTFNGLTENDAQIGDTVYFQTTVTIPEGSESVVLFDKMDDGFTLNVNSIVVTGATATEDYTLNTTATSEYTFKIEFTDDFLTGIGDGLGDVGGNQTETVVTVTYSAVLNENAPVKASGTTDNDTWATYGAGQTTNIETTSTSTYEFNLFKHASGNDTVALSGAEFELYLVGDQNAQTKVNLIPVTGGYRVAKNGETTNMTTTIEAGSVTIKGLDKDSTYILKETKAPDGYNRVQNDIPVTVQSNPYTVKVANNAGSTLPTTGGMGTKVLFTVGGIMMVVAFVLFTSKRRMAAED